MGRRILAWGILVLGCPVVAGAQDVPLARFISDALASAAKIERPLNGSTPLAQGDAAGHFYTQALKQQAPAELDASLAVQLNTFPAAFAWGAAASPADAQGEFRLRGAGSSWVESPATLGRGHVSFTLGHEAVEYGRLDGANLRDTSLALWTAHDDCCSPVGNALSPEFERDLLEQRFVVDVDRQSYAFFGAVGVTNRLDLGIMVPIVTVRLDARITSRIVRVATADTYVYGFQTTNDVARPVPHAYDDIEIANRTTYHRGEQRGIGDILVKAKYRIAGRSDGVALSVGASLPTGDPDKLLGSGSFRGDATLLLSRSYGRFTPHANIGYTYASGNGADSLTTATTAGAPVPSSNDLPDVLHAVAGVDWAPHRRVQFSVDAMGRRLSKVTRFTTANVTFPLRGTGTSAPPYVAPDNLTVESETSSPFQLTGLASTRVFIASRLLCTVEVLLPLNKDGLQTRVGAVAGLSWGF